MHTFTPPHDIEAWVARLSAAPIPILRQTARRLDEARRDIDRIGAREIAAIVLHDPLMAVRVLAYTQPVLGKRLRSEIATIGHAVMMLGVEPFFRTFDAPLTVEAQLKDQAQALLGVLQLIRRAQHASRYAYEWALERHDINVEEVALAALLHDLAEILWSCFAPQQAIAWRELCRTEPNLRGDEAQRRLLGFTLAELQKALGTAWHLPELLNTLMDEANADLPRVQNVTLAAKLARHSADDWRDPSLPADLTAIATLLHVERATLCARLNIPADVVLQPPAEAAPPSDAPDPPSLDHGVSP